MVALIVSFALTLGGTTLCFAVGRRRPRGTPVTWGEAFVGATVVFALFLLAYGIVPHQWLTYADNTLLWRKDKLMLGISADGVKIGKAVGKMHGTGRIIVDAQAVRDMIATAIYGLFLGLHILTWSMWQKRGTKKASTDVVSSSAFGRPVTQAAQ